MVAPSPAIEKLSWCEFWKQASSPENYQSIMVYHRATCSHHCYFHCVWGLCKPSSIALRLGELNFMEKTWLLVKQFLTI